jgi:hypothetical protein
VDVYLHASVCLPGLGRAFELYIYVILLRRLVAGLSAQTTGFGQIGPSGGSANAVGFPRQCHSAIAAYSFLHLSRPYYIITSVDRIFK